MFAGLLVLVKLGHERPHMPDLIGLRNDYTLQVRVVGG